LADHGNGSLRRIDDTGASSTPLRLSSRRRPVAVPLGPAVARTVAAVALKAAHRLEAWLITLGAEP